MSDTQKPPNNYVSSAAEQTTPQKVDGEPGSGRTSVEVPPAPKGNGNADEKEKNPRKWRETVKVSLPFLFSIISLVITFKAYQNTGRSADAAEDSAGAAKRSADAAGKTADAAQKNVATAQAALKATIENSRLDHRAWVGIAQTEIVSKPVAGQPLSIWVTMRNTGKSPAVHTHILANISLWKSTSKEKQNPIVEDPKLAPCKEPKPRREDVLSGSMMMPGTDIGIHKLSQELPEGVVEALTKGKGLPLEISYEELNKIPTASNSPPSDTKTWIVNIYLAGCVDYFDAFGEAHRTSFCYQYDYKTRDESAWPVGGFFPCSQGNDAD